MTSCSICSAPSKISWIDLTHPLLPAVHPFSQARQRLEYGFANSSCELKRRAVVR